MPKICSLSWSIASDSGSVALHFSHLVCFIPKKKTNFFYNSESWIQGRRKHVKVAPAMWETASTGGGRYERRTREHLGGRGHALPENFENLTPLKRDLQHFQVKSIMFLLHCRAKNLNRGVLFCITQFVVWPTKLFYFLKELFFLKKSIFLESRSGHGRTNRTGCAGPVNSLSATQFRVFFFMSFSAFPNQRRVSLHLTLSCNRNLFWSILISTYSFSFLDRSSQSEVWEESPK